MRVIILSPSQNVVGGVERFCSYLKDIFEEDENAVQVISPEDLHMARWRRFGFWSVPYISFRLGIYAERLGYDIVVTNGALGWNLKKGRIVNVQHGNFAAAADAIDKGKNFPRWLIRKFFWGHFEKIAARHAGTVVAVSEETARFLKKYYHIESTVIGNAVDADFFRHEDKDAARTFFQLPLDKKLVLFVGRIGYSKRGTYFA